MPLALAPLEWTAIFATGFAAVSALAAWRTALVNAGAQRRLRRPHIATSFLRGSTGKGFIEFVNGGPGMALHVRFFGVEQGVAYHGHVGYGHLASEATETVEVGGHQGSGSRTAEFVTVCRDVDGDTHIFSYDERDVRLSPRKAKRVGEYLENYFRLMYPDVAITSRPTALGPMEQHKES